MVSQSDLTPRNPSTLSGTGDRILLFPNARSHNGWSWPIQVLALGVSLATAGFSAAVAQQPPTLSAALDAANGALKTCLQRHYRANIDSTSEYRLGADLAADCRAEWDQVLSTCVASAQHTPQFCDAQTKMMLLGFVPMR